MRNIFNVVNRMFMAKQEITKFAQREVEKLPQWITSSVWEKRDRR